MKHALLGASLGWIAAAGWSAPHWFAVVCSVLAVVYLVSALLQPAPPPEPVCGMGPKTEPRVYPTRRVRR